VTKLCRTRAELWEHLICEPRLPEYRQVLAGGVAPDEFIGDDVSRVISRFVKFRRYGLEVFYPCLNDVPEFIIEAFDIVSAVLERKQPTEEKGDAPGRNKKY